MNIQRFKNNEIRKIICRLLGKSENEPIYTEELNEIERLNINPRIFNKPTLDVDLGDLYLFKNLKYLYIRDINITDYQISCINQVQSLKYLQINKCILFKLNVPLCLENLEGLFLISCSSVNMKDLKHLYNLKFLKVICSTVEKYKGLENLQNLEELYLQKLQKVNLAVLLKMDNLKLLNLDGSTVKREKHEKVLSGRIKVSHDKEYFRV